MIPITSYHEARVGSEAALTWSLSPLLTATFQSGGVIVIAISHDTGPLGSKYLASERNSRLRRSPRIRSRSVQRPPGWTWPAVTTSEPLRSTVQSLFAGP